jgi:hypothetical protein
MVVGEGMGVLVEVEGSLRAMWGRHQTIRCDVDRCSGWCWSAKRLGTGALRN